MVETKKRFKTIYIAGPMRGMPNHNLDSFYCAEGSLRSDGWAVINPVKFNYIFGTAVLQEDENTLRACMDAELAAIPHLDAIYLMKGWEKSEGARQELLVALKNNLVIVIEKENVK